MLLMMPITLVNQAVVRFGLNEIAHIEIHWRRPHTLRMGEEIRNLGADDLLCIAGAEAGLHHCRRIDIDLELRVPTCQNVALEVRRDIHHEGEFSAVHHRNDVPFGYQFRRLPQRRKESMGNAARKLRLVLIDDGDGGIVQLLRTTSGLQCHGQRKCINNQSQEHEIAQETAQFLDAQPIDICGFSHGRP